MYIILLYAHSWDERLEWICPICTKDDRVERDMKWEHILKNIQLGPYQVENVAELLNDLYNTTTVVSVPTIGMFLIIKITIGNPLAYLHYFLH